MLCLFFKQGTCHKGNKCKFSHDLSVENKTAKRNVYVDSRDIEAGEGRVFLCTLKLIKGTKIVVIVGVFF